MKIDVQSIHFDADTTLVDFINEKVKKLAQLHDEIVSGKVFLRLDRSDNHENKIAEIKVIVPGRELFARKQCRTFEEATDTAVDALRRQIMRHRSHNGNS